MLHGINPSEGSVTDDECIESTSGEENGAKALRAALASAEANDALTRSEVLAHHNGVVGTPTWIAGGQRISGLRPRQWFEDRAATLTR